MVRYLLERRRQRKADGYASDGLVTVREPTSVASEAYRTLATTLLYSSTGAPPDMPPKVILITSPGPKEGKSVTCANLGVVLAQAGESILIMDCDLRRPSMHKIFKLPNTRGIMDTLVDEYDLLEVSQEPLKGLKVATAGPLPPNPAELLLSKRFVELASGIRPEFDYVLIDSPPVIGVPDPTILASQVDGVLLVFDAQKSSKASLRRAKRDLETVRGRVLGTVMNNSKDYPSDSYHSYYG